MPITILDCDADDHTDLGVICPACNAVNNIMEVREGRFYCGDCGATWAP